MTRNLSTCRFCWDESHPDRSSMFSCCFSSSLFLLNVSTDRNLFWTFCSPELNQNSDLLRHQPAAPEPEPGLSAESLVAMVIQHKSLVALVISASSGHQEPTALLLFYQSVLQGVGVSLCSLSSDWTGDRKSSSWDQKEKLVSPRRFWMFLGQNHPHSELNIQRK